VGRTLVNPLVDDELKLPGEMLIVVDPLVAQFSVLLVPELMLVGFAVNEVIEGADPDPDPDLVPESAGFPAFPQPGRPAHASKTRTAAPERRSEAFSSRERPPMRMPM
jgi:hypothetical protein